MHQEHGPLDKSRNSSHENYWETVPGMAGDEYALVATKNARELEDLRASMYGEAARTKGSRSESAKKWYYKLGTHNSLKGANQDLWFAAQTVLAEGDEELSRADVLLRLQAEGINSQADTDKLLAVQMLIDATRDPSERTPAEDMSLINTLIKSTAGIVKKYAHLAESRKGNITDEEKRILSDALKFNFDARTLMIENLDIEVWEAKLIELQAQALKDQAGRADDPNSLPTKPERIIAEYSTAEDLKQYHLLQESYHQVRKIRSLEQYLSNGLLNELYFIQLVRHMVLSKGSSDTTVSSSTVRQDKPHDHIYNGGPLRKTSYDASISGYYPNETLFVQLKAGMEDVENYHDGVLVINPFGEKTNQEVRAESVKGLMQLQRALGELVDFTSYDGGSFSVLESHVKRVRDGLSKKVNATV